MEFEASHGTVSDMFRRMKEGQETSLNPLGMVFALKEAMKYSAKLYGSNEINEFADVMYSAMCKI